MGSPQTIAVLAVERRRRRHAAMPRSAVWFAVSRDLDNLAARRDLDLELRVSAYVYLFPEFARQLLAATEIKTTTASSTAVPHA